MRAQGMAVAVKTLRLRVMDAPTRLALMRDVLQACQAYHPALARVFGEQEDSRKSRFLSVA
jgi:hypothetical protein